MHSYLFCNEIDSYHSSASDGQPQFCHLTMTFSLMVHFCIQTISWIKGKWSSDKSVCLMVHQNDDDVI